MPSIVVELLQNAHFWVGIAFAILVMVMVRAGVPRMLAAALDDRAAEVQAQLDEATRIRQEAEALLADIRARRNDAERQAAEMLAAAQADAARFAADARAKLEEQVKRRAALAERKIATAEAQAAADVKAAAAELAAQAAERVLAARIAGAKSDPLVDAAIGQLAERLQ